MRDVLSRASRPVLEALARDRTLLAFDFDGTIAAIVADRDRARPSRATARWLEVLASRWPVAVISGRSRADVRRRLLGVRLVALVGSHGAETRPSSAHAPAWRAAVREWRRTLRAALDPSPGIAVEDKGLSLAVHFRGAGARRRVLAALRRLPRARLVPGKSVVNVVPGGAPRKGDALAALVRGGAYRKAFYAGDDRTDEDAFRRRLTGGVAVVGVAVGRRRSAAPFRLRRQRDVTRLLRLLAELRPPTPGGAPRSSGSTARRGRARKGHSGGSAPRSRPRRPGRAPP